MPPFADDDPGPSTRRSLWRDLNDDTAGGYVRLFVCIAVGIFLAGAALVMSYVLAALVPSFNRPLYNYMGVRPTRVSRPGAYPSEGLIAAMMMIAGAVWMGSISWLYFRGIRQRPLFKPILITIAIVVVTFGAGILADSSLQGEQEIVITGLCLAGAAAVLIVWVQALRQFGHGRPLRHHQDQLLDVRCPECGYRMVGLHESRCPECGRSYTLDELLARQDFAKAREADRTLTVNSPAAPAAVPPVPSVPPPVPHRGGVAGRRV